MTEFPSGKDCAGSDCYRNTTIKYGAITNGVRARVNQLEEQGFLGFVHFTGRFSVGCDVCVVCVVP